MITSRSSAHSDVQQALADNLAAVLLGPRQVGKTTLARQIADGYEGSVYLDLERAADLRKLDDAGSCLAGTAGRLTIIDEVHRAAASVC